jgi:hypothetical protein
VTVTIQARGHRTLLFRIVTAARRANSTGRVSWHIKITYNPGTQVRARVTAEAKNAAGSTVNSAYFTILHDE